jgi:hypothetical protein
VNERRFERNKLRGRRIRTEREKQREDEDKNKERTAGGEWKVFENREKKWRGERKGGRGRRIGTE